MVVFAAGILLTVNMISIISVIGPNWIRTQTYPLFTVVRMASIGNFIERIDAGVIITMIVGGFLKWVRFYMVPRWELLSCLN